MNNKLFKLVPIMGTIMRSKENQLLELFFNYPIKKWHFEVLLKESRLSRSKATVWLTKFVNEKLIKKIKETNKMPYYVSNYESPNYQSKKRLYAMQLLYDSGLMIELLKSDTKTIIIFGSFSRWDWHKDSDIDIFSLGKLPSMLAYEKKLHREINIISAEGRKDFEIMSKEFLKNLLLGIHIKGDIFDVMPDGYL